MTTYNTGNAIGSTDPRDLYDNAQNIDEWANSESKLAHPDRLGVSRRTFHGMESEYDAFMSSFGYIYLGDYAAGLSVTASNQLVKYDGEYWKPAANASLPFTTSGTWVGDDDARFVSVGDAALRSEIGSGVRRVSDIASLRGISGRFAGDSAAVLGYYSVGDGGGGPMRVWQTGAVGEFVDNGYSIIVPTSSDGSGAWVWSHDGAVNVRWFGAVGDGVADDTSYFQDAADYIIDGDIYVSDGTYSVTGLTLSGYIRWRLKNATVNGTETPQLPGMWVGFPERFFGDNAGSTGFFRFATATRNYRLPGGIGHTEGLHVETDVNDHGNSGEMAVGINGTAKTNSKGSVFGINGYAKALSSSTSIGTEVVGGEVNTDVNCPTVTRKVGFQIVDVAGSTGTGTTHDYGEALIKQGSTATGFNVGYQIGYDGQPEEFPVRDTATSRIFRVGGNETNKVAIGFDFGYVRYGHAAIQLYSQKEGQVIGWGPNGNASNLGGMIRSDCSEDNGGALIFKPNGLSLQDGSRVPALNIDTGPNPVEIVVDSIAKQVTQGAADSGGAGYRVLRVPNT